MLTTKLVTTEQELRQIAVLSEANLSAKLSAETKAKEGFVSWFYNFDILRAIHAIVPSVIVKNNEELAAYALTLTTACSSIYPNMAASEAWLSSIPYKGRNLSEQRYYVMGQICIAEPYRGQGLVAMLYEHHRRQFSPEFDFLVTEISTANPRSLKAHQKIGFRIIKTHRDNEGEWNTVLWDWS
jgi:ribosomal protein S18 acetylase RimI-like enzyme